MNIGKKNTVRKSTVEEEHNKLEIVLTFRSGEKKNKCDQHKRKQKKKKNKNTMKKMTAEKSTRKVRNRLHLQVWGKNKSVIDKKKIDG